MDITSLLFGVFIGYLLSMILNTFVDHEDVLVKIYRKFELRKKPVPLNIRPGYHRFRPEEMKIHPSIGYDPEEYTLGKWLGMVQQIGYLESCVYKGERFQVAYSQATGNPIGAFNITRAEGWFYHSEGIPYVL